LARSDVKDQGSPPTTQHEEKQTGLDALNEFSKTSFHRN
jgi:hypothetical protein